MDPVFDKSGKQVGTVPGSSPFYFATNCGSVWRWDYASRAYHISNVQLNNLPVVKIKPIK